MFLPSVAFQTQFPWFAAVWTTDLSPPQLSPQSQISIQYTQYTKEYNWQFDASEYAHEKEWFRCCGDVGPYSLLGSAHDLPPPNLAKGQQIPLLRMQKRKKRTQLYFLTLLLLYSADVLGHCPGIIPYHILYIIFSYSHIIHIIYHIYISWYLSIYPVVLGSFAPLPAFWPRLPVAPCPGREIAASWAKNSRTHGQTKGETEKHPWFIPELDKWI